VKSLGDKLASHTWSSSRTMAWFTGCWIEGAGAAPGEQSKRRHRRRPNPRVFSASRRVEGKNQLLWPERGQRRRTNRCVKLLFSRWELCSENATIAR